MDQRQSRTAADIVNGYEERELYRIIRDYGEDKFAKEYSETHCGCQTAGTAPHDRRTDRDHRQSIPMKIQATGGHPAKRTFRQSGSN